MQTCNSEVTVSCKKEITVKVHIYVCVGAFICLLRNYISIKIGIRAQSLLVTGCCIFYEEAICVMFLIFLPELRIRVMTQTIAFMRNWSLYSVRYYYTNILLQDLDVKVGRLTVGSRSGTSGSYA
jgi:hypothetical protein